jgi:uncharacterized protein (TIGR00730 family)
MTSVVPRGPATPVERTLPDPEHVDVVDDDEIKALIADAGIDADVDQIHDIVATGIRLGHDRTDRLDLKIVSSALLEMRAAFRLFSAYRDVPKVTIFGSARTLPTDPGYVQTHHLAAALAAEGWMVVTGAGPGIMQAAAEGAGADHSIGVSIRLPFETEANAVIAKDPKLVSMKYFFTRKLMLVKESKGFVSVPGGFGTLDETFELLTLQQTGKAEPSPMVWLDYPHGTFWHALTAFVDAEVTPRGLVSPDDLDRVLVTDSVAAAVEEIVGFYRNYDSLRWVGKRLVLRLRHAPTDDEVDALDAEFGSRCLAGGIERVGALGPERADDDKVDLPRIAATWDPFQVGDLHKLIRATNALASASPRT